MVFFDTESAALTTPTLALLENVRNAAAMSGAVPLKIVGHADRAGSDAYNRQLSARRAGAVKAWLLARGVPGSRIGADAVGEDRPIVQTEDGVAQAQNRFVSISLGC
ncbi:OmpA family protein [Allosphingosinicella deserti]|nr:OmpA family protein [Sphingomonas deserti]